jgi:hypothetical protein
LPEKSVVSVEDEMANLSRRSTENKLVINLLKIKEIVFHKPDRRLFIPPPLSNDIKGVNVLKLLVVSLCPDLRFGEHISFVEPGKTGDSTDVRTVRRPGVD